MILLIYQEIRVATSCGHQCDVGGNVKRGEGALTKIRQPVNFRRRAEVKKGDGL